MLILFLVGFIIIIIIVSLNWYFEFTISFDLSANILYSMGESKKY